MSTQTEPASDRQQILEAYVSYPFDSDPAYQQGLASILSSGTLDANTSDQVREEIHRKTRVFYFNKITSNSISPEEAYQYEQSRQGSSGSALNNDENRVLTLAELKELIETGNVDKIPNNKIIPEGLNTAPPSESVAAARKKPWETAVPTADS
ncbi:hypothetical protein CPC08DRAFT_717162 [Agrocybe pediades]|nr:hypothetical protein CPC08DRAFT_717162 [Agrocybe pediades]